VAATLGAYRGYQERLAYQRARATLHYQQGMEYLKARRLDLARKELEFALRLEPDHAAAQAALQQLQQLEQMPRPQANPSPTPTPIPTTSPNPPPSDVLASAFEEATAAFRSEDWEGAIDLLESIRLSDEDYRRQEVEELLFEAYVARGRALIAEDRMEEALRMFDRALALRPDAADVRTERERAALYIDALSYWWADWDKAIERFQQLYDEAPDYRDVRQRLLEAHIYYAEKLGKQGDWCAAVQQYDAALSFENSADLRASRDEAEERCRTGVGIVLEGAEELPGRLALAAYDTMAGRYRIFVIPSPQEGPQVLVEDGAQPSWSPDGQFLAFRSLKPDELGLELFTLATGERHRLTHYVEDGFPSWSPDGQQIVFASNREGDRRWRIYRMWVGDAGSVVSLGFGRSPAWSPDGQQIIYQGCDDTGNRCGLWSMAPDGSNKHPVTDVPSDTAPAWSPDGQRVAFMSYERAGHWDIYLLDVETQEVSPLVVGERSAGLPVWSPDGQWIAFMLEQSGVWGIYVIPADGGDAIKVTDLPGATDDWLAERLSWGP
jgi:TolB protein